MTHYAHWSRGRTPSYAANPYTGESLALAKLWMRGYQTMLTVRTYPTRPMQCYLANHG